jgi:hypothetical protein
LARWRWAAISVSNPACRRDVALSGDLLGQLQREAVRVVEGERVARTAGPSRRQLASSIDGRCAASAEALLLLAEHADDEVGLAGDVGVRRAHHLHGDRGQARHHQLLGAEQ